MLIAVAAFFALVLWIYCIFDVIAAEESLVRHMPKLVWLVVVIFLSTIGSLAWLILGRPAAASFVPGATRARRSRPARPRPRGTRAPTGPEDSPEFLAQMHERASRLRREEERRLRDEQGDPPGDPQPPPG